jgi:predicted ATP-grasp superfamily ATP-dependent carboligase
MGACVITGISGVLLWLSAERQVDTVCLLAEAFKEFPDARAAAELVRTVDNMLKMIEVDLGPLMKQAEELESQIKRAVEAAMEAQQTRATPQPAGVSPGMYY